jgi:hypothetical protein
VFVAVKKSLVSARIPVADHRCVPPHLGPQPVATRPGLSPARRWRRTVTFCLVTSAQAALVGQPVLLGLGLLLLASALALRPALPGSRRGHAGPRAASRAGWGLAPAGRDCAWCVLGAAVAGILAGVLGTPAWLITLVASATVTALLIAVPPATLEGGAACPTAPGRPRSGRTPTRLPDRLDAPVSSGAPDGYD